MYSLRPYQISILELMKADFTNFGNSIIVAPTGSGKSLLIASLANWLNQNVLIICYTKEILDQNKEKLSQIIPKEEIGIYSASFNSKEIKKYTLATIGSIYKHPELFTVFKVVLIDELHTVPHKKTSSMYIKFLKQIGSPKVYGFSGTPYRCENWGERLSNGYILSHTVTKLVNRCMNPFWSRIIISLTTQSLIDEGYLCQPTYIDKELIPRQELKPNASHSDFDLTGFQKKLLERENELLTILEWANSTHRHTLVFCVSVAQAEHLSSLVNGSAVVSAKTPKKIRTKIIHGFKLGLIKTVFNVNCLTTGFDFPALDCIVVCRPTNSIGLHVQMLGRGMRNAPGKKTCDIIDLVGNVKKLGKAETIRVERVNGQWEIVSETGCWHNKELYSYTIKQNT